MLVCSVHDPAIFDAELFDTDRHYEAAMDAHLDNVRLSHLLVCDDAEGGSVIWRDILTAAETSPYLTAKLNACLNPQRIVYLPCEPSRRDKISARLGRPSSATAVGLICHGHVDVLIAGADTYEAMRSEGMATDRTCAMGDYHKSKARERERLCLGGRPVTDLKRDEFLRDIVTPAVYWARRVTVIDKFLVPAAFGVKESTGRPSPNWPKFRTTLQHIYEAWQASPYAAEGTFEIVSSHNNVQVGDKQAAALADKLGLKKPNVVVSLKSEHEVAAINHDRYLVTDKDVCIGFTKGFDLLGPDDSCGVGDVYLRQHQTDRDTVAELIHARSRGQWYGRRDLESSRGVVRPCG